MPIFSGKLKYRSNFKGYIFKDVLNITSLKILKTYKS